VFVGIQGDLLGKVLLYKVKSPLAGQYYVGRLVEGSTMCWLTVRQVYHLV